MRIVMDFLYLLAGIAISPMVLYRMVAHNRYRQGWANRFGKISRKSPDKKCFWIHAVSVGEVNATRTIVKELKEKFSDFEILISTTTDTGFERANALYGDDLQISYFPLDFSCSMARAFRRIKPSVCLLMELEVWPNFVRIAQKQNVPVVVVNGRISDNSFGKYKKIKPIAKRIFQNINLILAQTNEYAKRFEQIGCPKEKIVITGSLKYDTAQITDKVKGTYELAARVGIDDEKLLVAGGTGNNEEKILLNVFNNLRQTGKFDNLRLVLVPRKPERFNEVAELITQAGLDLIRYSQVKDKNHSLETNKQAVILGDTMGDLRKFYSLATIIFVGRSLVPMGGSDMAEAAALGKCTILGPHAYNFKQTVDALLAGKGALEVKDTDELYETVQKCLTDINFAEKIAHNGREVIRKNQGATQKTIEQIQKLLN